MGFTSTPSSKLDTRLRGFEASRLRGGARPFPSASPLGCFFCGGRSPPTLGMEAKNGLCCSPPLKMKRAGQAGNKKTKHGNNSEGDLVRAQCPYQVDHRFLVILRLNLAGVWFCVRIPVTNQLPSNLCFGLAVRRLGVGFPFTFSETQGFKSPHHQSKPSIMSCLSKCSKTTHPCGKQTLHLI